MYHKTVNVYLFGKLNNRHYISILELKYCILNDELYSQINKCKIYQIYNSSVSTFVYSL